MSSSITIRPLQQQELPEADQVCRLAFGIAAGLPDPLRMFGDADYMHRWYLETRSAIAAFDNHQIVGTNFLSRWGSLGGFGPLTVHPDYWNQGVASQLMTATMAQYEHWQTPAIARSTTFSPYTLTKLCSPCSPTLISGSVLDLWLVVVAGALSAPATTTNYRFETLPPFP